MWPTDKSYIFEAKGGMIEQQWRCLQLITCLCMNTRGFSEQNLHIFTEVHLSISRWTQTSDVCITFVNSLDFNRNAEDLLTFSCIYLKHSCACNIYFFPLYIFVLCELSLVLFLVKPLFNAIYLSTI